MIPLDRIHFVDNKLNTVSAYLDPQGIISFIEFQINQDIDAGTITSSSTIFSLPLQRQCKSTTGLEIHLNMTNAIVSFIVEQKENFNHTKLIHIIKMDSNVQRKGNIIDIDRLFEICVLPINLHPPLLNHIHKRETIICCGNM